VLKLGRGTSEHYPLHSALLKTAKLHARINSESGADSFMRACLGEAGFEVYCTRILPSHAIEYRVANSRVLVRRDKDLRKDLDLVSRIDLRSKIQAGGSREVF